MWKHPQSHSWWVSKSAGLGDSKEDNTASTYPASLRNRQASGARQMRTGSEGGNLCPKIALAPADHSIKPCRQFRMPTGHSLLRCLRFGWTIAPLTWMPATESGVRLAPPHRLLTARFAKKPEVERGQTSSPESHSCSEAELGFRGTPTNSKAYHISKPHTKHHPLASRHGASTSGLPLRQPETALPPFLHSQQLLVFEDSNQAPLPLRWHLRLPLLLPNSSRKS